MMQNQSSMGSESENVIFITIDSLRHDRLGLGGRSPSPSPNIDSLARQGVNFQNYFVTGCPTQFSIPMIFSSTMPLDHGGCAKGLANREDCIAELFQSRGYATAAFASGITMGHVWKLGRGFGECYLMMDLALVLKTFRHVQFRYIRNQFKHKKLSFEKCVAFLKPAIFDFFYALRKCIEERNKSIKANFPLKSPLLERWDYDGISTFIDQQESLMIKDPAKYIYDMLCLKDLSDVLDISNYALYDSASIAAEIELNQRVYKGQSAIVSAGYVLENMTKWMTKNKNKPFFLWAHFMDIHYHNYMSYDLPGNTDLLDMEQRNSADFHREMKAVGDGFKGDLEYDLSVNYIDFHIGKLISFLKTQGLADNTILVITSDHGSFSAKWPVRAEYDSDDFYDELYKVPALIYSKRIKPDKIYGLCSAIDIAPTLLDIMGIEIPASFVGQSACVGNWAGRQHVVMEHTGRGPCDLSIKGVNICVRSDKEKVVYVTPPPGNDNEACVKAVYNIENDSLEKKNIVADKGCLEKVKELVEIAKARAEEIDKQYKAMDANPQKYANNVIDDSALLTYSTNLQMLMCEELIEELENLQKENRELRNICDERLHVIEVINGELNKQAFHKILRLPWIKKMYRKLFH